MESQIVETSESVLELLLKKLVRSNFRENRIHRSIWSIVSRVLLVFAKFYGLLCDCICCKISQLLLIYPSSSKLENYIYNIQIIKITKYCTDFLWPLKYHITPRGNAKIKNTKSFQLFAPYLVKQNILHVKQVQKIAPGRNIIRVYTTFMFCLCFYFHHKLIFCLSPCYSTRFL